MPKIGGKDEKQSGLKIGVKKMEDPSTVDPKAKDDKSDVEKKQESVNQESFVTNFIMVYVGDLDSKMKMCFEMYDFDQDGYITPEDVRIMMSYMPFKRNVTIQNV